MKSVLIVDDDHEVADTLAFIVKRRGYAVTVCYNGESAVEQAATRTFDIAFLDILLPGINGVECLVELKKRQPEMRAIMMTGFAGQDLIAAAGNEGALDVLRKPVMPEDILARLSRFDSKSLLIVDDDTDFAESMQAFLHRTGWKTARAKDGAEAVASAKTGAFAAMVLDLKMPSFSGFQVLIALKQAGISLPTIVVSGEYDEGGAEIDSDSLMAFMRKPVDPRALLHEIEKVAVRSRAA